MSGVNVTVRPFDPNRARSINDGTALINTSLLKDRVTAILTKSNISSVDEGYYDCLKMALQERLRFVVGELVAISKKRKSDNTSTNFKCILTSDTKNALREIEKEEREHAQIREAEEKQRILAAAKNAKKDKKENKVLQDKLNKVVREEEARRTNDTALLAIGNIRVKKKSTRGRGTSTPRGRGTRGRGSRGSSASVNTPRSPSVSIFPCLIVIYSVILIHYIDSKYSNK